MNPSECIAQVAKLVAAFPSAKATDLTASTYVDALVALEYPAALAESVAILIASERWLPTVSLIRETYSRVADKHRPPALMPAELTEEQEQQNRVRWRAMTTHIQSRGSEGHSDEFETCEHPDCIAVKPGG